MRATEMMRLFHWIMWVGLVSGLLLTGGCTRFGPQGNGNSQGGERGVPVEVVAAEQRAMAETVTVTGTIRAAQEADVSAQITAEVVEVTVREGDPVKAGQVLIRLDRDQTQSQVRQAEAGVEAAAAQLAAGMRRLEVLEEGARDEERAIARSRLEQAESALRTAEADLSRLRDLFEEGAVSKQQLDVAQTAYDTARTNRDSARQSLELTLKGAREEEIDAARKDVEAAAAGLEQAKAILAEARKRDSYAILRSPLTGIVVERHVEPGEVTNPGMGGPLLTLADPSSVYYEATVPERVALRVNPAQRVNIVVQGDGDRVVEGRVERIVPVANPQSRDFLVRIDIVEGEGLMKPGMFARGSVVVEESADAVVIPKDALVEREGKVLAFVVKGDVASMRDVVVGITDSGHAEIVSGVEPGEVVVVVGGEGLQDGDPVLVRANGDQ